MAFRGGRRSSKSGGKKDESAPAREKGSPRPGDEEASGLADEDAPTLATPPDADDEDDPFLFEDEPTRLSGAEEAPDDLDDTPTLITGGVYPEGDDDEPTLITGPPSQGAGDDDPTVLTGHGAAGEGPSGTGRSHPRTRPSDRPPPKVIGNYRLLKKIGEGGMGEVWKSAQIEPVRRKVALKIIKKGMDTKEVVARFEHERQALAVMDHPCIAKVFDAGETPLGRPYFVMEYVRGVPITEHCDRRRLPLRGRLELFMEVCEGVQHAHQKAIIHRDIKPSNVLVTFLDGKAEPKIIDFGVAKATTAQEMDDRTMYTELGQMLGTPAYMSPEQASMTGEGIDTRTDVYALGVLLYVLLTGALPFDPKELKSPSFDEVRRNIIEVDPPTPSARFGKLDDGRTSFAGKCRGTEPRTIVSQLRGDLDWICMKALEKDRSRRYGSPADIAADIRRYLQDEPVLATPPSRTYLAKKFVRRHKIGVAAVAAGVVTLASFAVTMTIQAGRIARERDRANQEAATALQVSDFLVDLFEVSDPSESLGNTITAREILDRGAYDIRHELRDQPQVQARLMNTIGEVYRRLGLYDEARPLLEEALHTFERTSASGTEVAATLEHLGVLFVRVGEYDSARPLYDRALALRQAEHAPGSPEIASVLSNLGTLSLRVGDYGTAQSYYEEARDIWEEALGPWDPKVARAFNNLANLHRTTGETAEARRLNERALAIFERAYGRDHPDVAQTLNQLGWLLFLLGDHEAALGHYERSLEIRERVLGVDHPDVARSLNSLAVLHQRMKNYKKAEELHERALSIREGRLGPDDPEVAQTLNNLAILHRHLGDYAGARERYQRSRSIWERVLGAEHPRVQNSFYNQAILELRAGDRDAAIVFLEEAVNRGFANDVILEDEDFEALRGDPTFESIVERVQERLNGA